MSVIEFAYKVDKVFNGYERPRSSFSQTQKDVMDQMISDHYNAGSSVDEAAEIIWRVMLSLEF